MRYVVAARIDKEKGSGGAFVQPVGGDPRTARVIVVPIEEPKK